MEETAVSDAKAEPRRRRPRGDSTGGRRGRGRAWRWLRRLLAVLVVIALLPLALTLVYAIPAVHPVSTLMVGDLADGAGYVRQWTRLDDFGRAAADTVLMSEDGQFCAHHGVDWGALNSVINDALSGERARGASTIPMQTVRNLFLWQGRSYVRKALEIPLALYFDAVLSKRREMEIYLNIAQWGDSLYGAEAAAQHYFGKHARELTRHQAALLAVTLPNPTARDPAKPSKELLRIAAIVERRLRFANGHNGCLR